jgi:hypothetical protein
MLAVALLVILAGLFGGTPLAGMGEGRSGSA